MTCNNFAIKTENTDFLYKVIAQHCIKSPGVYIVNGFINEEFIVNVKNGANIDLVLNFKIL